MKNVKFASISDQLINTAIIMDMMFNTEMIVKDMKGGKEEKFSIICDKNQDLKTENKELKKENKELKKENHRLSSHLNEDKLRYMDRFIHQNKVIYDNLTEEYYNVENNSTAQSLTNVLNNLNDELNQNKELVDIFKSSIKKYDIFRIIGWCCLVIGYFIIVFY